MGEALISRAGGMSEGSSGPDIPILPGYHTVLITLKDYENKVMPNYTINCKDGPSWYNYTTNEKGQALFTTNSGSANFTVFNTFGARYNESYIDFTTTTMNIDAPLGQVSQHDLVINKFTGYINLTGSGNYKFLIAKNNIWTFLCGGGGGGGGGDKYSDGESRWSCRGGSGGSGYTIQFNHNYLSNTNYQLIIGIGGAGGRSGSETGSSAWSDNGNAGGTTSFANNSARGGSGGGQSGGVFGANGTSGSGGNGYYPYGTGGAGGLGEQSRGLNGNAGVCRINII